MRIVFFTDTFYPSINGIVTSISNYAQGLAKMGHQLLIIGPKDPSFEPDTLGFGPEVTFHLVPSINFGIYPDYRLSLPATGLLKVVREFQPDLIHTHTPLVMGLQGVIIGKQLQLPLVTTQHTYIADPEALKMLNLYKSAFAATAQKTGLKMLMKQYLTSHDLIIVPSQDVFDDLKGLKIRKKIQVLPTPVPVKKLIVGKKAGLKMRQELGISQGLLFAGRISGEKNIDISLDVFAELKKECSDLKFVLIGDGPVREALFAKAFELGISSSMVWMGAINHDRLIAGGYYFLGDIFITMSRFETQGLSTIEAMACGLPVIGAKAHATAEMVGNGGLVLATKNPKTIAAKMALLLKNKKMYEELSQAARERAAAFTIESCTDRLISLYDQVISEKQTAAAESV